MVLVVDDDEPFRVTLAAALEEDGFAVVEAGDGLAAVRAVEQRPEIALMVCDVRMPMLDGVDALRRIRERSPSLPVIMITATSQERRPGEAVLDGAYAVIRKPFPPQRLVALVRRALSRPAVLVVDRDPVSRFELGEALLRAHHASVGAGDCAQALDALEAGPIDVALVQLDPAQPDPDTLHRLRQRSPELSIIALSDAAVGPQSFRALQEGAVTVLTRPIDRRALVRLVAEQRGRGA